MVPWTFLLFQMEALFDQQTHILEEKLQTLRTVAEKLENNVESVDTNADNAENDSPEQKSKKRNLEYEQSVLSKMFKLHDDEDDD